MQHAVAGSDAEAASAQAVLRQLDRTFRAARTYGLDNAATRRFFDQLLPLLAEHLGRHAVLGLIVDRGELLLGETVVFRTEEGEGLGQRLAADGVRELHFWEGLDERSVRALVEALSGRGDDDEDVVTRLWAKDVANITFVTADDIAKAAWIHRELAPQEHGYFAPPPSSYAGIVAQERSAPTGPTIATAVATGGAIGFEVQRAEQEVLAAQREAESARDGLGYVLDAVHAILTCETHPDLLTRALAILPEVLDHLLASGEWESLLDLVDTLGVAAASETSRLEPTQRFMAARALDSLHMPQRLARLEQGLAASGDRAPAALERLLAKLPASSAKVLCQVLATAASTTHRQLLQAALVRFGPAEEVVQALADPRPGLVRDLVAVVQRWGDGRHADSLALLARHVDVNVRRDALAAVTALRPSGDGAPFLAFANDAEKQLRFAALRVLGAGAHTLPWEAFRAFSDPEQLFDWPLVDKRSLFHAMRGASGDAAVPFLAGFLTQRGWSGRARKEEAALAAVDVLALHGTKAALEALEAGAAEASGAVQKACAAALAARRAR